MFALILAAVSTSLSPVRIWVNQAGYAPLAPKVCVCENPPTNVFSVLRYDEEDVDRRWHVVYTGTFAPASSGIVTGDFSCVRRSGDYRVMCGPLPPKVEGRVDLKWSGAASSDFVIHPHAYDSAKRMFLQYYAWQRCGSRKGWAGLCHQAKASLVGTHRMIDVHGGYHQSADLRNWADGISMSCLALLRYAELETPSWDEGELEEELRWGIDYFLRLTAETGYAYECQFEPIWWGPRNYYPFPAPMGAQANIAMLFARASRYFASRDAAYSKLLADRARKVFHEIETNPYFETPPKQCREKLPQGTQPKSWYAENYRTTATGFAQRAAAALELHRALGDAQFAELARKYAREALSLVANGQSVKKGCSYAYTFAGERVFLELALEFGEQEWKDHVRHVASGIVDNLLARNCESGNPVSRGEPSRAADNAIFLLEASRLLGEPSWAVLAQRALDYTYGANPGCVSFIDGIGQNQARRPVFGQFFPSTPQIPGAVLHVRNGEYDMPAVGMTLWATAAVERHFAARPATGGRKFAWRGFMLDCSRHFFTVDEIKRQLDLMHEVGLNVFHWHLVDASGWRMELRCFPELTQKGAERGSMLGKPNKHGMHDYRDSGNGRYGPYFYTQDQVREVIAHATARGIRVVPEIEMPGHSNALSSCLPQITCNGGKTPGAGEVCLANPKTKEALKRILDETIALFPDEVVHIGGDECNPSTWNACSDCRRELAAIGSTNMVDLQCRFMGEMVDYLAKKGRRAMCWQTPIYTGKLPKQTIIQVWNDHKGLAKAVSAGHDAVMSLHTFAYFDYPQALAEDPYTYPWFGCPVKCETIYGRYDPYEGLNGDALRAHVLGGEACAWTEYTSIPEELDWKTWPRLKVLADVLNAYEPPAKRNWKVYRESLEDFADEWRRRGVNVAPVDVSVRPELYVADRKLDSQPKPKAKPALGPIVYVARRQYAPDHHNTGTDFTAGDVSCHNVRGGAAIRRLDGTNMVTLLDCPKGVIRDLEVSYDASRLLFSMRRAAYENFAIWEMNADGTGLRRITDGKGADIDPAYLPDGRIVFSSNRDVKYCGCNWHLQGNIFRVNADGTGLRQLGRNNLYESRPSVLPDGRIIYDRWNYVDRQFGCSFGLWTMFPDGRTQALFYGENAWRPGAIFDARAFPGGGPERVVCVFGACHDRPWGALVALDRRRGLDGMEPIVGSFPANITNMVVYTADYGDGRTSYHPCESYIDSFKALKTKYEDPYPLDGERVLVSRSEDMKTERMAIYLCDFADGSEFKVHEEAVLGCYDPQPLKARTKPPALVDAVDDTKKTGVFYVGDVYHGTGMEKVRRGSIKWLRIVEAPPKRNRSDHFWNTDTTHRPAVNYNCTNTKRVLGVVPVEADGSALFEVEANRFVYFQALDEKGMMVQSMRNGTTLQPGELAGCTGCHEDRLEATPPLRDTMARSRRPSIPKLEGETKSFSYMSEIQPIWNRNCLKCHDYGKPGAKAVNLAADPGVVFNVSYMELRRKIALRWYPDKPGQPKELLKPVDDGPPEVLPAYAWGSHRSRLVDMLDAGHGEVKLTAAERSKIVEWIDLNMPYYPTYETQYPERPYGRCPLTFAQTRKLVELTGDHKSIVADTIWARPDATRVLGTGVNFARPELSLCLSGVTGEAREQALAIIREGGATLRKYGRPDLPDITPEAPPPEVKRTETRSPDGVRSITFDILDARKVVAIDFVADENGMLPEMIDLEFDDRRQTIRHVKLPKTAPGAVYTLPVPPVVTRIVTIRTSSPVEVKARVRIVTFAGHYFVDFPTPDRVRTARLGEVKVPGHVGEVQDTFFSNRIRGEYARSEIWKEAHEAFAHPDDDVFNHGIGMWKGEFWGKLMISASRVAEHSRDEGLRKFLHDEALSLIKFQRADGYLGTYVDSEYIVPLPLAEQQRRMGWPCSWNWNLWCRKYTLWGLLACYRLTGDKAILEAADKAMTQQIEMLRRRGLKLCDTGTQSMHGFPPCSILKPLLWLYQDTGKQKYLEYAREIIGYFSDPTCQAVQFAAKLATGRPMQDWYPEENGKWGKAYEMMSCLDGFIEYYRVTGDRSALELAVKMRERILADELNLCLSVGYNDQFWGARRHLNGVSEPCDAIHWMRLNHDLWLVTGEAKYVDAIETTFYNAFLAGVRPDGKWGARCVRSHGRHQKAPPQSGMTLQHCCVNNMPRGFMDVAQSIAAKDRDGTLCVAMYHDAEVKVGDDAVRIAGNYPVSGDVSVNVCLAEPGKMRFRVPEWCPALAIGNGARSWKATAPGWFEVDAPKGDSRWTLRFDMSPRIVASNREPVASYDAKSHLVTRWARNEDGDLGERDLMPLLVKKPMAQVMWGPMLLAKSVKVGSPLADIADGPTVNEGGWRLSVQPLPAADGVWGTWRVVFEKGGERRECNVCDYSSAALWTNDKIEFSTFF